MAHDMISLEPRSFRSAPWKNGGGVALTIAQAMREGATPGAWHGLLWSLSRTAITTEAPFSDLAGLTRLQCLVAGEGLVLETPVGAIDVRHAFRPVRFDGGTPIISRLEAGPVEVVNLMGDSAQTLLDLAVLTAGAHIERGAGCHILYAATEPCVVAIDGTTRTIAQDHALRIDAQETLSLRGDAGRAIVASIVMR